MTMIDYSDDEDSSENSDNSDDSEIILPRRTTRRTLINEIKENPELYTTRRSERNRKETIRYDLLEDNISQQSDLNMKHLSDSSSSSDNSYENESDNFYTKRCRKNKSQPKMEFRKRVNVSYKEVLTSDDDRNNSDESDEPKRKYQKVIGKENDVNTYRDNPLINKPRNLLRALSTHETNESMTEEYPNDDLNTIEEVINFRFGRVHDTGLKTTFYNERLKNDISDDLNSDDLEKHYLIKWKGWSYIHSTWESETSLSKYHNLEGIRKFCTYKDVLKERENWKKNHASPEDLDAAQFEEERDETLLQQKMECDRIIDCQRHSESNCVDYLVKWKTLDYRNSTWESGERIMQPLYSDAIREFEERIKSTQIPNKKCEALSRRPKFTAIREQPEYLKQTPNFVLRDYQLDGLNWIARSWTRGNSVILADEMGLGKTVQTISFLSYLFNEHSMYGPFLIVLPLSTISGWQTEFSNWAPYMNVVYYTGDALSRQIIRETEWYRPGDKKMLKFNVCVTTYELLLKDKAWLTQISWAFLGIDEAHRLKNDESQLYQALVAFNTNTRLLVTGTPVHNSLKELWALLHFIMPDRFDKWIYFEEKYNFSNENGAVTEVVNDLYKVLEPFLLRRIKKDVEKSLPSKLEQIIRVPMCRKQADIYKLILTKNYEALSKETRGHTSSFLNIVMELKKCCNHTQLVNPLDDETEDRMDGESRLRYLVKGSGKMMLLDKLMAELRDKGHRVLIFSQMVRMLDLISDYLVLRGWGFQRLDGSIKGSLRKQAIDHFNAEGSTDFCFLLSTRAGGLGINLATADTVVIFDSDWNPQNDLQAMARAHRIGQKKQVSVYRFVIKNSIEEKIIECAKRKMVLDHLVIQRMDSALNRKTDANRNQPFNKEELNEILKFGAADLFGQEEQLDEEQELNIEDILLRAETRGNDEEEDDAGKCNPARELLSAFKVVNITETAEDEDIVYIGHKGKPRLWSEIVPQELRDKVKEEEHRRALKELELGPRRRNNVRSYQIDGVAEAEDEAAAGEGRSGRFNEKEVRAVLRAMRKLPGAADRAQDVMAEAELVGRREADVTGLMAHIVAGCTATIGRCDSEDKKLKATFKVSKVVIGARALLQAIEDLEVLHRVLPRDRARRLRFELPFETKFANWNCVWDTEDDARLLVGIYERGMDNWEQIKMDPSLKLGSKILPASIVERPQSSHLRTRVEYLLKKLSGSKRVVKPADREERKVKKTGDTAATNRNNAPIKIKTAEPEDVAVSAEEAQFYEMRGDLFDKCAKKMKPIKEQLKYLEDKQRRMGGHVGSEDRGLTNCVLSVGNHIRSVISSIEDEEERRKWRNYLWSFVNFFFDALPKEELHRMYKTAYKKSLETSTKGKKNGGGRGDLRGSESRSNRSDGSRDNGRGASRTAGGAVKAVRPDFEARSYHEYKMQMKGQGVSERRSSGQRTHHSDHRPSADYTKPRSSQDTTHNSRDPRQSK